MIHGMDHLPTTEAAVTALRVLADAYEREIEVTHDIGADQTSRRTAAGVGVTTDPDGSLPHEAHVAFGGLPRVSVRLYPEDDALIDVEGVECPDIARATTCPPSSAPSSTDWRTSGRVVSHPGTSWWCRFPGTGRTRSSSPWSFSRRG